MLKKRGQVWIETVIYTLIGLTIIGILISIVTPKINQMSDRAVMSQSINSLSKIDEQFSEIIVTPGNSRQFDLFFKKGEYIVDPNSSSIYYVLRDTGLLYSQLNSTILQGEVNVATFQKNGGYVILASLNYSSFNITYDSQTKTKVLSASPSAYKILIENKGLVGDKTQINLRSV